MARFLTAPRRQMVNPYPEVNVDFYSNLMNQTQQNLNQATQMKASAMEQAYNLPFTSQEDYEAIVTPMKERFEGMLDKEFVSHSEVARTIMDTRGEMQPRIAALQNKAKELQMQRQLQTEWGLDWMGNDVSKMSIVDTDPSQIRGVNFNRKQIRDAFIQSKSANFTKEIDSGRYEKLQGFPGDNMYGRVVTSGLTDQQKAMYAPGTELAIQNANEYFNSLPETAKQDLIAITGSPEAALQTIQQTQYEAVNDPRFAYSQKVVGAREYTPEKDEGNFNNNNNIGNIYSPYSNVLNPKDPPKTIIEYQKYLKLNEELENNSNLGILESVSSTYGNITSIAQNLGDSRNMVSRDGTPPDKDTHIYRNNLIDAAITLDPKVEELVYKNKNGDWVARAGAASYGYIARVLDQGSRNPELQKEKVSKKLREAEKSFMEEYGDSYTQLVSKEDSPFKDNPEGAITHLLNLESNVEGKTYSYNLNNPSTGEKLRNSVLGAQGSDLKVYKVNHLTSEYSKESIKDRTELSEENLGKVIDTKVNTKTGATELSFENGETYAISNESPALSTPTKGYAKAIEEFVDEYYSYKSPENTIYVPSDIDMSTGTYIAYKIKKDLVTGKRTIQELRVNSSNNTAKIINNDVSPEKVINRYLTYIFGSTAVENPTIKTKLN